MKGWKLGITVFMLAAVLLSTLVGCGKDSEFSGDTRTITDMKGNEVTIPTPKNIERAAVVHSPIIQVMYIIGAQDKLCAVTTQAKMWPLIAKFDPNMANVATPVSGWEVNLEALIATDPDLCIGSDRQIPKITEATSIPCLQITTNEAGAYFDYQKEEVRFFGDVFGKEARAEKYCKFLDKEISLIAKRVADLAEDEKPRVLIASEQAHSGTYGSDSYMQEWLEAAGCRNAAESLSNPASSNSYVNVSVEQMLAWDPDILLITYGSPEDLYNDPVWSNFRAVQDKKVYRIPAGIFIWNRPTAEGSAQFPIWMAMNAYPDLFDDMTIESEIKRFWSEIVGFELSDEDVYTILHPGN